MRVKEGVKDFTCKPTNVIDGAIEDYQYNSISPGAGYGDASSYFLLLIHLSNSTAITIVTVTNPTSSHSVIVSGTVLNTH